MRIPLFQMERMQSTYENYVEYNLSESGVHPMRAEELLGGPAETARLIAAEMARGAVAGSQAQIACAISGIAGPSGGSDSKPVGTVCFAWCLAGGEVKCTTRHLSGDRREVRAHAVGIALEGVLDRLTAMP